jgi:hypothetical protein
VLCVVPRMVMQAGYQATTERCWQSDGKLRCVCFGFEQQGCEREQAWLLSACSLTHGGVGSVLLAERLGVTVRVAIERERGGLIEGKGGCGCE